ncbi:MAG: hypothetical protein R3F54_04990 [Alphaproteobacteria bacterium]
MPEDWNDRRPNRLRFAVMVVLCLVLTAAPVTFDAPAAGGTLKIALAKNAGGNGGGKGNGGGDRGGDGGRSGGGKGHGGDGAGHGNGPGRSDRSFGEVMEGFRSGKAFGLGGEDKRVGHARDRYHEALAPKGRGKSERAGGDPDSSRVAHRFSPEEAKALIGRGWKSGQLQGGFRNHGERVRTMVAIAKALGYDASVGALQANFGTPGENGITDIQAELDAAREAVEADPDDAAAAARVDELEAALADAVAGAKPGRGPGGDWATADLDVNDDGVVDRADLDALGEPRDDDASDEGGSEESPDGGEPDEGDVALNQPPASE